MTGIQPASLLADEHLYGAAVEQAERAEWTLLHELLAVNIETTDRGIRQAMANAGMKQSDIPKPFKITRPGARPQDDPDVIVMRPHEFGKMIG